MQSCLALVPDDLERIYLAYSGGLDSSVLLHLLVSSRHRHKLVPWHINHGLLDAATAMEQFCTEQARHYDLEIRIDRIAAGEIDSNIEATARKLRYGLFEAGSSSSDCIVTAHHADDQAETFLLNALRGSGSAGLRGIAQRRKLGSSMLLRPLLGFSREQLEDYASRHELAWFDDPSNRDSRFDRNYLRNEVIPSIRKRWPHFREALVTTSQLQAETQQILDEVAQHDYELLIRVDAERDPTLELAGLLQLSPERAKNLLRYWVATAGLAAIPGARLREVMKQLQARPDAMPQVAMPGYSVRLYDQRLFLVRNEAQKDYQGIFEFGLKSEINIDGFNLHCRREVLFKQLQLDDNQQQVTLRYRGDDQQTSDRHRLKRLFQKHRIPPWERRSTAQVYLDDKLAGLLL
jgi:tRNA(Ile)-lysidine synthase